MNINAASLAAIFQGFNASFNSAFELTEAQWEAIAMTVSSTSRSETYAWLGRDTRFRKWLGDRVVQSLQTHGYTIANEKFENTVGVLRDDIEDDGLGVYTPLFQRLGEDSKRHPDELVFALLGAGFSNTCYDGQYFFDTDHPVAGASVSNMQAGSGVPWYLLDTSRAIKPLIFQKRRDYKFVPKHNETDDNVFDRDEYVYGVDARVSAGYGLWQMAFGSQADLTLDNYADARAAMMSFKSDNDKPLGIKPTLLVVPPALEKQANDIIKSERLANGQSNTYMNTAEILVSPWLS